METKKLGVFGEDIAVDFLKNKGYKILDRNYSLKFVSGPQGGEIDIIAKQNDIISFVEVKTLTENSKGPTPVIFPEQKVNWLKQKKIIETAQSWLIKKKIPLDIKWQIDIMAIRIDLSSKKAKIRHFKNAVFLI